MNLNIQYVLGDVEDFERSTYFYKFVSINKPMENKSLKKHLDEIEQERLDKKYPLLDDYYKSKMNLKTVIQIHIKKDDVGYTPEKEKAITDDFVKNVKPDKDGLYTYRQIDNYFARLFQKENDSKREPDVEDF